MTQYYTQKTAALKATKIDTRIIDAKSIQLNGKDIENIGYQDGRVGTLAPSNLDLWKGALVENEDGTKEIKDLFCPYNVHLTYDNKIDRNRGWCNQDSVEMIDKIVKINNSFCMEANDNVLCYFDSDNLVNTMIGFVGSYYTSNAVRNGGLFSYPENRESIQHGLNIESFSSPLPNLIIGQCMFSNGRVGCEKLKSFTSDLPKLKNGNYMFMGTNLQNFDVDMPLLESAHCMFYGANDYEGEATEKCQFKSFTADVRNLKDGHCMFLGNVDLKYFGSIINEVVNGKGMFAYCTSFTDFNSSLPSLICGMGMFSRTKLNSDSLLKILDSIRDIKSEKDALLERINNGESPETVYDVNCGWQENGNYVYQRCSTKTILINTGFIDIGLGIDNTDEARQQMAEEMGLTSWEEVEQEFADKGWTVGWQYNGNPSTSSYSLRREETTSIWAKIEEVLPEVDEEGYEIPKTFSHVSKDDHSKKYKLLWFHSTNGSTDGYQYFDTETAACEHFGIISKNEI